MQTLQHIPVWVFGLLIGLIALGLLQTRTRHIPKQRLLGINIGLTVFTLVGVVQQWRPTPWLAVGLFSWAATCSLVAWGLGQGAAPAGASYDAVTRRFTVPGSWLPLALFMAIFACKFQVGMLNATAPDQLHSLQAAIGLSALYGLFSGWLNARALRLLKLARTPEPARLMQACSP
ncbi:hypothetical protein B9Z51_13510 [Limnohabitans sp. T6-5]|uniref:DUF6622 family protein n=1 Tax=Limnohabitans sp. T6-5 TaxID=1100724 RepID=UPI000D38B14D|nr:DUF6622 family protein [Limnohabitans sp. T6-5]PUE06930.1 hypothetical protein B9Z51_13510 [Limnohabitans sp. T6-5]